MKHTLSILFTFIAVTAFSCTFAGNGTDATPNPAVNTTTTNTQPKLRVHTTVGDITVVLYNETPKHRDNFLKLVGEHYYDSVLFHRVIREFMIQTGDGSSRHAAPGQLLGSGDLNYTIPAEFVYPRYFHKRGALAAARTADQVNPERASSGSQFYIVTGRVYTSAEMSQMQTQLGQMKKQDIFRRLVNQQRDTIMALQRMNNREGLNALQNSIMARAEQEYSKDPFRFTDAQLDAYTTIGGSPHLDGQYTVFGEVVDGMDVVARIEQAKTNANDRPIEDIRILSVERVE